MQDSIKAKGSVRLVLYSPAGEEKAAVEVPNLVVTAGRNFIASRMVGTSDAAMSHMAIGSGTAAPALGNTTLGTELGRVALTSATLTGSSITYVATFGPGVGTGAITEAGLFNAASAGTMLCRTTFAVINKGAGDTLGLTWTVTVS